MIGMYREKNRLLRPLMITLCLLAIAAFVFAHPSVAEEQNPGRKAFEYASEHIRLTASFDDDFVRLLFTDGREMTLPRVISASGARYSDGTVQFWTKGNMAYLDLDDEEYEVSIIHPETDPWEKARREGVIFRAVGQEPGWVLHIRNDHRIDLSLDYGDTHITTPIAIHEINYISGARTYRTMPPSSPLLLTISIQEHPCYDVMSGEGFTASVTVEFDVSDRVYQGCGRDLSPL